jgi:HEAT repeat protein
VLIIGDDYDQSQVNKLAQSGDAVGLLEILERGDVGFACQAAIALAKLSDRRAVDPILVRLRAIDLAFPTDDEVQQWGIFARALGKLAEPRSPAADELLAAVEERQGPVAWDAIEALEAMGEQQVIEPLLRRLKAIDLSPPTTKAVQVEWETVAEALGELKARQAVDALIAGLGVDEFFETSAFALGDIGDPRAVPTLVALLEVELSDWNANAVFVALHEIGTPDAMRAIAASEARGGSPPYPPRPPRPSFRQRLASAFARLSRRSTGS